MQRESRRQILALYLGTKLCSGYNRNQAKKRIIINKVSSISRGSRRSWMKQLDEAAERTIWSGKMHLDVWSS